MLDKYILQACRSVNKQGRDVKGDCLAALCLSFVQRGPRWSLAHYVEVGPAAGPEDQADRDRRPRGGRLRRPPAGRVGEGRREPQDCLQDETLGPLAPLPAEPS